LIALFSVSIKKLDAVRAERAAGSFDATAYARNYWDHKLLSGLNKAVDLKTLLEKLEKNKDSAFNQYSHALGIGNVRYFLVSDTGTVTDITPDEVVLDPNIAIQTEYIFGNAVRDASGLIDINDFRNTMDFNNVSVAINKIIRSEVLPTFRQTVKKGDRIAFTGATQLNSQHLKLDTIKIIPIRIDELNR
jgi:predicted lipoprotein